MSFRFMTQIAALHLYDEAQDDDDEEIDVTDLWQTYIVRAARESAEHFVIYSALSKAPVSHERVSKKLHKYVVEFQREGVAPADIALFAEAYGRGIDEATRQYAGLSDQRALVLIREKDYLGKRSWEEAHHE